MTIEWQPCPQLLDPKRRDEGKAGVLWRNDTWVQPQVQTLSGRELWSFTKVISGRGCGEITQGLLAIDLELKEILQNTRYCYCPLVRVGGGLWKLSHKWNFGPNVLHSGLYDLKSIP